MCVSVKMSNGHLTLSTLFVLIPCSFSFFLAVFVCVHDSDDAHVVVLFFSLLFITHTILLSQISVLSSSHTRRHERCRSPPSLCTFRHHSSRTSFSLYSSPPNLVLSCCQFALTPSRFHQKSFSTCICLNDNNIKFLRCHTQPLPHTQFYNSDAV